MHLPGKDSNQKKGPSQEEAAWDCKPLGYLNLEQEQDLQQANSQQPLHIVEMKEQKETVLGDKMLEHAQGPAQAKVQELVMAVACQLVVDDGIYKLHQICSSPFSHSTSNLFHPETVTIIVSPTGSVCKTRRKQNETEEWTKQTTIQTGRSGYPKIFSAMGAAVPPPCLGW